MKNKILDDVLAALFVACLPYLLYKLLILMIL